MANASRAKPSPGSSQKRVVAGRSRDSSESECEVPAVMQILLRVRGEPAEPVQVAGDGLAQARVAQGRAVGEIGGPGQGDRLVAGASPGLARESRQVRDAGREVVPHVRPPRPGRRRARGTGVRLARRQRPGVGAVAGAGLEVALAGELLVGVGHQPPGDAQLRRQLARGGQPDARPELARGHRPAQPVGELQRQRAPGGAIEDDAEHRGIISDLPARSPVGQTFVIWGLLDLGEAPRGVCELNLVRTVSDHRSVA